MRNSKKIEEIQKLIEAKYGTEAWAKIDDFFTDGTKKINESDFENVENPLLIFSGEYQVPSYVHHFIKVGSKKDIHVLLDAFLKIDYFQIETSTNIPRIIFTK